MRKLWIISAIILAVALSILALSQPPVKSFTVSGDGTDVMVYNRFPSNTSEAPNFTEDMVAATNLRGTVWLDASRLNKTTMQDYCDRMVLKSIFRPMGELTEQWYIDVAEKTDEKICVEATNQAEENGFL